MFLKHFRNLFYTFWDTLCKASLQVHNSTKMCVNEFLERSIRRLLPTEFAERKKTFEDEMSDIAGGSAMEDGRVR